MLALRIGNWRLFPEGRFRKWVWPLTKQTGYHPGLRFRLIQLVLIAVFPALGLILYGAHEQRQKDIFAAENEALRLVRVVSKSHEHLIDSTRHLLIALSHLPDVRRRDGRACSALFSDLLKKYPLYTGLTVANADGDMFCSAPPLTKPVNVADRPYFQQVLQQRNFVVGEYHIGRITGKAILILAYPVIDESGAVTGAVIAPLDLSGLGRIAVAARLPENFTLTIYDRHGTVLARHPDTERWVETRAVDSNIFRTVSAKGEGISEGTDLAGEKQFLGFTSLGRSHKGDLYLTIGIPAEVVLAGANRTLTRNLAALVLVFILALIAAWYGGDIFVLRGLGALIRTTERIGAGDLSVRTELSHGANEIGRLAVSLDKMAEVLEARRVEAKRVNEELQQNLERARAFHEMSMTITSTLDLDAVLQMLLDKIEVALPNSATTVRLINRDTGELELIASRNVDEKAANGARKNLHGLSEIVLQNKSPLTIANVQTDPRILHHDFVRRNGLVSYLGVPLMVKGNAIGLVAFYTKEGHTFTDDEVTFLTALASQSAMAIHNARLYDETKRSEGEISALHALTLAATQSLELDLVVKQAIKKITEIFRFDATRVYLFNTAMDELHVKAAFEAKPEFWTQVRVFRRGQGIVGKVAETGESFICEDIRHDPRYLEMSHSKSSQKAGTRFFAIFPIKTKRRAWGAMVCVGENARKLTEEETRLLTSMTNQIGIAVENATLYEQTVLKAKELSALYSVAGIASESLDLDTLLKKTMHNVLEIFGFEAARIYLRNIDATELHLAVHEGIPSHVPLLTKYKVGEGRMGRVVETGEPSLVADMHTDPTYNASPNKLMLKAGFRSSFLIPIRVRGDCLGVMNFLSKNPYRFSDSDLELINAIAYHVGIAVGNANLFSQVKQKAIELEKAIKGKDEFLGVMSHELRTPLNVIKGYTELMMQHGLGEINPEQTKALETVRKQVLDLSNMINSVLQVTKIEADAVPVEIGSVNLSPLLDELKRSYSVPFGKELNAVWNYPADLPVIRTGSGEAQGHTSKPHQQCHQVYGKRTSGCFGPICRGIRYG